MIRGATQELRLPERPSLREALAAMFLLTKPGIVAAIAFSGFTGLVVAAGGHPEPLITCTTLTSLVLAAAGSAMMNCLLERRSDLNMARLARRNAALTRAGILPTWLCALLLVVSSLIISQTSLGSGATLLLGAAIFGYTLHYTIILKRRTRWGAVWGGLPGALPVLLGPLALQRGVAPENLILFLVMLLWQPPHFWLLALGHRSDYQQASLPVLPLLKGTFFTAACILGFAAALTPATLLLYSRGFCSPGFALCATVLGLSFLALSACALAGRCRYRTAFRGSIAYLITLFTALILDLCHLLG